MVKVLSSFVRGPLEPHVTGFAEELLRLGYSRSSARPAPTTRSSSADHDHCGTLSLRSSAAPAALRRLRGHPGPAGLGPGIGETSEVLRRTGGGPVAHTGRGQFSAWPGWFPWQVAAMTSCRVGGLTLLVQTGPTAAERKIGYAVAAAPGKARRVLASWWPSVACASSR